jgi:hypothetical protein
MSSKCLHEPCHCDPNGDDACGQHCREAIGSAERPPTCECGHIACEEATMREGGVVTTER